MGHCVARPLQRCQYLLAKAAGKTVSHLGYVFHEHHPRLQCNAVVEKGAYEEVVGVVHVPVPSRDVLGEPLARRAAGYEGASQRTLLGQRQRPILELLPTFSLGSPPKRSMSRTGQPCSRRQAYSASTPCLTDDRSWRKGLASGKLRWKVAIYLGSTSIPANTRKPALLKPAEMPPQPQKRSTAVNGRPPVVGSDPPRWPRRAFGYPIAVQRTCDGTRFAYESSSDYSSLSWQRSSTMMCCGRGGMDASTVRWRRIVPPFA